MSWEGGDSSGWGGFSPSYGIGSPPSTPGLSVGNLGNYSLGSSLGSSDGSQGPTFGGAGGNYGFGGAYGYGDNNLGAPISGPTLSDEAKFSLNTMFEEGNKWGMSLKNPSLFGPQSLRSMVDTGEANNSLQNLDNSVRSLPAIQNDVPTYDPNKGLLGLFQDKTSLAYRLGLRDPGSDAARNFFDHQTSAEQADRMGLVGKGIDAIGGAAVRAMTPAPISAAMGLMGAYDSYQKDGNLQNAISKGLNATGGYGAAIGNALQGNWGASLSSLLGKQGVDPMTSAALGIGVDSATGKPISAATYGSLAGYFAGKGAGGPNGAVFGSNLGRTLGSLYSGKK